MNNAQTPDRHIPGPKNANIYARLAAVEEHLSKIIKSLDEIKILVKTLEHMQPDNLHTVED